MIKNSAISGTFPGCEYEQKSTEHEMRFVSKRQTDNNKKLRNGAIAQNIVKNGALESYNSIN